MERAPNSLLAERIALTRAAARGWRSWRDPAVRERARASAEAIAGRATPARIDAVARRHLAATELRETLILRPWLNERLAVDGLERLRAAGATGRGVIVSHCHWGPFAGLGGTVAQYAPGAHIVVGAWLMTDLGDDEATRRQTAWRSIYERQGASLIQSHGSYDELARLLGEGAVVSINFDLPGSHETFFLGRPTMLASGTARLAFATGALVVPAHRRLRRLLPATFFEPALDPRDHPDWTALHEVLAAHHSARIATDPALLEDPRRPGVWETGATADAWRLPER